MTKQEEKSIKKAVCKITTGHWSLKGRSLVANFGCNACAWRDTTMCPHKLTYPKQHTSGICSQRALYIRDIYDIAKNKTRVLQIDEAVRLRLLLDKLTHDFTEEGMIDPNLAKLSKNIISLLDKMRKQDEGIKLQSEVSIAVEDFRNIVDTHAEIVKDKDIVKEAELVDNKPDNPKGEGVPKKEV